jgi:hypothetical protein
MTQRLLLRDIQSSSKKMLNCSGQDSVFREEGAALHMMVT